MSSKHTILLVHEIENYRVQLENKLLRKIRTFMNVGKYLKRYLFEVKREIIGIINDRKEYLRQPRNEFTLQGYEVIPNFLDKEECDRLVQLTNRYLRNHTYLITENCFLECRKDFRGKVDSEVQQIMNAQELDNKLSKLFHSHIIEDLFEQRIGEKLHLQSITIQVDNIDTQTKRGFHNDYVTPTVYKAFIYLNDVNDYGDGPYTVIPGSHLHTLRKIINYLYGCLIAVRSKSRAFNPRDERGLFYSDKQSVSIFGKAGTLIVSNQQLAHKGWHNHDKRRRYALICYLVMEKDYSGKPFMWRRAAMLSLQDGTSPSHRAEGVKVG